MRRWLMLPAVEQTGYETGPVAVLSVHGPRPRNCAGFSSSAFWIWVMCVPTYVPDTNRFDVTCRWIPKFQEYCADVFIFSGIGRYVPYGVNTGLFLSKLNGNGFPPG